MSDFGPARLLLGKPMPADRVAFWWDHSPVYNCNVFHTREYLQRAWGRFLDIKGFVRRGHTYQDVVVMMKP